MTADPAFPHIPAPRDEAADYSDGVLQGLATFEAFERFDMDAFDALLGETNEAGRALLCSVLSVTDAILDEAIASTHGISGANRDEQAASQARAALLGNVRARALAWL